MYKTTLDSSRQSRGRISIYAATQLICLSIKYWQQRECQKNLQGCLQAPSRQAEDMMLLSFGEFTLMLYLTTAGSLLSTNSLSLIHSAHVCMCAPGCSELLDSHCSSSTDKRTQQPTSRVRCGWLHMKMKQLPPNLSSPDAAVVYTLQNENTAKLQATPDVAATAAACRRNKSVQSSRVMAP